MLYSAKNKTVFLYSSTNMHNAHRHMLENPPDGFEYKKGEYSAAPLPVAQSDGMVRRIFEKARWAVSPYYNYLHLLTGKPKIRKYFSEHHDVIHSTQSLLETNLPYVVDFEHASVFAGYNQIAFNSRTFVANLRRILESRNLKRLLPWTNAAKKSLLNCVASEKIAGKTEVVYPVVTPPKKLAKKESSTIKFLFIGGAFFEKGGIETLIAFDRFSRKYDTELTLVSDVPEDIRNKFNRNKKIHIRKFVPYSEVQKLYNESHVFVLPTHMDTFGFVIPEAMSYALPVIADASFSRPELVQTGKTGLLIKSYYSCFGNKGEYIYPTNSMLHKQRRQACMHPPEWYIDELANAMQKFILSPNFRERCAKNARKETTEGRFSPRAWKQKMGRIYKYASE